MHRTIWIALATTVACASATTTGQSQQKAATPVFAPPEGTYAAAQQVTVSSSTGGATLRCTSDGTAPTAASPACADVIAVSTTTTLKAIATAPGYLDSDVATAAYTIDASATPAARPTFSHDPGLVYTSAVHVTIASATAGATIHCTLDDSPATAASPTCSGPITVSVTTTIRAVATAAGHTTSPEARATYTIQGTTPQAARPTFSPAGGTRTSAVSVTISSTTAGATIHCTRDGAAATAASPACPDPIPVSSTTTLRAVATAPGHTTSPEATATYTLRAATPRFSPPGGTYPAAQDVTVSTATAGAVLRCTTNGADPTASSPVCADPIHVTTGTTTLKAIAVPAGPGWSNSAVATATYTVGGGSDLSHLDCALALSTSRQFWGHQSVGNYIMYGPAPGGGALDDLLKSLHAGVTLKPISGPSSIAGLVPGDWAEWEIPDNLQPLLKLTNFNAIAQAGFPTNRLDFAALKFCFVDFNQSTDVAAVWARYQEVMDPLESAYPGRVIYWTVPLNPGDPDNNAVREQMSNHIRTKYGATGRVFDFADLESHDAAGNLVLDGGVRTMSSDWEGPGGDAHPNVAGCYKFGVDYLHFMCNVKRAQQ